VLPAPSSLALSSAREGAATASLGSLGQGLTTLRVSFDINQKKIFSVAISKIARKNVPLGRAESSAAPAGSTATFGWGL